MISRQSTGGTELREMLPNMLLFAIENQDRASMTSWIVATLTSTQVKAGRDCYGFGRGIAKNSVGL
jgi:hypothetical protein